MNPKPPILNRYTSLPVALDVLVEKRLTLLSPETWEDRNDAFYLERYREEKNLKTLVAICFSATGETFHHWKIFSSGSSGARIEFDKERLLTTFPSSGGFRHDTITYSLVKTVNKNKPEVDRWPFLKRKAFKDEHEFRIIYESANNYEHIKHVDIDLSSVKRVILSPWLPDAVTKTIRVLIKSIEGCKDLPVKRSQLIENTGWKRAIK